MNLFIIDQNIILKSVLIFIRISCLFTILPIFGENTIPVRARLLCSVALSLGLYSVIPVNWFLYENLNFGQIVWMVILEALIGFSLGLVAKLFFEGFIMAANIVGYQMGFGTANLLIPSSEHQVSSFTALHRCLVMLIFLLFGLHYIFIEGLVKSFEIIPAGGAFVSDHLIQKMIQESSSIFLIAMKLSAPILIALLFAMIIMGLFARTVPQIQIFTMSFPISFFIGMTIYISTISLLPNWLKDYYQTKALSFFETIYLLKP